MSPSTFRSLRVWSSTFAFLFLLGLLAGVRPARADGPPASGFSLGFVQNQGQYAPEVLFYAPMPWGGVFVTRRGLVLDAVNRDAAADRVALEQRVRGDLERPARPRLGATGGTAVFIGFPESEAQPRIEAQERGTTVCNYFLGANPTAWRAGVPTFGEVRYRDLWKGIDLAWSVDRHGLNFTFISSDGAALPREPFTYQGASCIRTAEGVVELVTASGAPVVNISMLPGSTRGRITLETPSRGEPEQGVRPTSAGRSDPSTLRWSTLLGGSLQDDIMGMALDSSGNPVVVGFTQSTDFPTTPGVYDRTHNGNFDVCVAKLSSSGTTLLWATFLGGSSADYGLPVTIDPWGNPVVCGTTQSSNYPVTTGAYDTSYNGGDDGFITKLSSDGGSLLWSTFLGGSAGDDVDDCVLDPSQNVLVIGRTASTGFPTTTGVYQPLYGGGPYDAFVAKLDATGHTLVWSTFLGGSDRDYGNSIILDASQNPILLGDTGSTNFPTTPNAYDRTYNGGFPDAFLAKLNSTGTSLVWATYLGGSGDEWNIGLVADTNGNLVVAGETGSTDFPTTEGAFDRVYGGGLCDAYVSKLDSTGSTLVWSTYLGGYERDLPYGLGLDSVDRPIVSGWTMSADFPVTADGFDDTYNGDPDVFVTMLDALATSVVWSTFLGASGMDIGRAQCMGPQGSVVVAGYTASSTFPVTPGAYDISPNGGYDGFVAEFEIPAASAVPGPVKVDHRVTLESLANPSWAPLRLLAQFPGGSGATTLTVLDPAGRRVTSIHAGATPEGRHLFTWDGRDALGRAAPTGIYLMRLEAGEEWRSVKIVLVR